MANRTFTQFSWSLEKNPVVLFANVTQGDVSTVTTVADSSSDLAGTFFRITGFKASASGTTYMFWFKVGGAGTSPATASDVAIEVDFAENATASTVAQAIYDAAIAATTTTFNTDFSLVDPAADALVFTALGGGCANAHDGLSMYATSFTFANAATNPILNASKSLGIKSFARTGAGLYTMVLGTPAPTSVVDVYNRLFFVGYSVISANAVPVAPLAYVVSETVSTTGAINFKLTAADGSTAADPACGEVLMFEIYVKNSTGQ